jgi:hypothetical protein
LFGPELCSPRKDPSDCDHSGPRGTTFERAEDEPGRSPAPEPHRDGTPKGAMIRGGASDTGCSNPSRSANTAHADSLSVS